MEWTRESVNACAEGREGRRSLDAAVVGCRDAQGSRAGMMPRGIALCRLMTHHTQCSLPEPMAEMVVSPGRGPCLAARPRNDGISMDGAMIQVVDFDASGRATSLWRRRRGHLLSEKISLPFFNFKPAHTFVKPNLEAALNRHSCPAPDTPTFPSLEMGDDARVLWAWRAMCPELQEMWPEDEQPEDWEGVMMDNGRVAELELEGFDLTGAVPAEIGQLTSLERLWLQGNELTRVPGAIRELRAAGCSVYLDDGVTVDE